jgi:DNA invertase Pin-like site-specific DNA recombinase
MGRKKGPDVEKIKLIRKVLRENPDGLWVREIARKTGLDDSTVSRYLAEYLDEEMEEVYSVKGQLIKIVKLKRK